MDKGTRLRQLSPASSPLSTPVPADTGAPRTLREPQDSLCGWIRSHASWDNLISLVCFLISLWFSTEESQMCATETGTGTWLLRVKAGAGSPRSSPDMVHIQDSRTPAPLMSLYPTSSPKQRQLWLHVLGFMTVYSANFITSILEEKKKNP